jgi:tetratricopeptide (TPR) repeat protein
MAVRLELTLQSRINEDAPDGADAQLGLLVTAHEDARAHFEAGEYGKAREAATKGLASQPEDVELLRLAGRAGVEIGAADAVEQLQKVVELAPDDATAWRDLGDALATEGRGDEANEAFQKVLELDPDDSVALTALGHAAYAAGRQDDAVSLLEQVAGREGGATTAAINLVEMYKALGENEEALEAARKVAEADPDDALAQLDVAELSFGLGRNDEALAAFARLRTIVDTPEQQVAALHGMIRVELAAGNINRALELAREARAIDNVGLTRGILAHLEAETGGEEALQAAARDASAAMIAVLEAPPSRAEVEAALDATLADARREWAEHDRRLQASEIG